MQFRVWRVPVTSGEAVLEELNAFAAKHRILEQERRFVEAGLESFWAVWLCYEPLQVARREAEGSRAGANAVDYRQALAPEDFAVFAKLRALRKRVANEEGVPVFAIFNNKQLATMVTDRVLTAAEMRRIPGVGTERIEKYADVFLCELREMLATQPGSEGAG